MTHLISWNFNYQGIFYPIYKKGTNHKIKDHNNQFSRLDKDYCGLLLSFIMITPNKSIDSWAIEGLILYD